MASILISAASFIVAVAALYRTALKGADIELTYLPQPHDEVAGGSWSSGVIPGERHLRVAFYCHNTGASAGVLTDVAMMHARGWDDVLYGAPSDFVLKTGIDTHPTNARAQLPLGVVAGEVVTLYLTGRMSFAFSDTTRAQPAPEEDQHDDDVFAHALHSIGPLKLRVSWSYIKRRGWLTSLLPGTSRSVVKHETLDLEIAGEAATHSLLRHWMRERTHEDVRSRAARLVAIATTGEPPRDD